MTGPAGTAPRGQSQARSSSRVITRTVLRAAATVAAVVVIFYLLPLDHASTPAAVTVLVAYAYAWRRGGLEWD